MGFIQILFDNFLSVKNFQHLLVVSTPGFWSISVKLLSTSIWYLMTTKIPF